MKNKENKSTAKPHKLVVKVVGSARYEEGTILVEKTHRVYVPKYDRSYKVVRKMVVHHEAKTKIPLGADVEIQACRPRSKKKNYKIINIISGGVAK